MFFALSRVTPACCAENTPIYADAGNTWSSFCVWNAELLLCFSVCIVCVGGGGGTVCTSAENTPSVCVCVCGCCFFCFFFFFFLGGGGGGVWVNRIALVIGRPRDHNYGRVLPTFCADSQFSVSLSVPPRRKLRQQIRHRSTFCADLLRYPRLYLRVISLAPWTCIYVLY